MRASSWAVALAATYVAVASLQATGGRGPAWIALVLGPAAILVAARRLVPSDVGATVDDRTFGAARAVVGSVAIAVAAATDPRLLGRTSGLALAAAIASLGALTALQGLPSEGGLLGAPAGSRARGGTRGRIAVALAHLAALSACAAVHLELGASLHLATGVVAAASLFAGGVVVAEAASAYLLRRLELGVAERAASVLQIASIALLAGLGAAAAGVASPALALPIAVVVTGAAAATVAVTREATTVRRATRIAAALSMAAIPPALFAGWIARTEPRVAPLTALGATLLAAAGGLAAPAIGRLLAPARTRRVATVEAASTAALHPDPEQALEGALRCLRDRGGSRLSEAALYRVAPPSVTRVDRGGFVSTEPAEIPNALLDLALAEPFAIARERALRAAEVRRPDVRPLGAWLADRRIDAAVVVRDETGAAGLLAVPPAPGAPPMDLEEARLLRDLADRLGAALAASSALARAREREALAHAEARSALAERDGLREALARGAKHLRTAARLTERSARAAPYGPAARSAIERLERLGATSRALTLLAPPGVDAAAWAAVWHLSSDRADAVLLVVDGVASAREPLAFWRDPATSPIEAAAAGTLVILDPQALPLDAQSFLGASAEKVALAVAVPKTLSALVAEGRLNERLADPLGDRAVAIPPLAARGEDLRGLAQDHLARAGVRLRGAPLGIEPGALAQLLEHAWPGNDVELEATLLRAAVVARGPSVTAADLATVGFLATPPRPAAEVRAKRR